MSHNRECKDNCAKQQPYFYSTNALKMAIKHQEVSPEGQR